MDRKYHIEGPTPQGRYEVVATVIDCLIGGTVEDVFAVRATRDEAEAWIAEQTGATNPYDYLDVAPRSVDNL